jgi:formylglycine-generating enzyme required for sulfatase activity
MQWPLAGGVTGVLLLLVGAMFSESSQLAAAKRQAADNEATDEADMQPYTEAISGTEVRFDLVPIRGGTFLMGSPEDEEGRNKDEGPQHPVRVEPFWMGKHEVTWDEYDIWSFSLDIARRKLSNDPAKALDKLADAVTRPTKPYTDMTFGMGHDGFPALCMTQLAAKKYCEWLSAKTGRYYRLPTEAEWEYACRAGTTTAFSFGDDAGQLDSYGWYFDNSDDNTHPVGRKKPNPWGLYDMHGNVAEWCLDQYLPDFYSRFDPDEVADNPLAMPTKLYPRAVRGGSWEDDPKGLRSAARLGSDLFWKAQDPQIPQSNWYHTDALFLGFRVVRPLREPDEEQRARYGPDASQFLSKVED